MRDILSAMHMVTWKFTGITWNFSYKRIRLEKVGNHLGEANVIISKTNSHDLLVGGTTDTYVHVHLDTPPTTSSHYCNTSIRGTSVSQCSFPLTAMNTGRPQEHFPTAHTMQGQVFSFWGI